ncbi:Averufin oxidase A [Tolypocladium ophioglossoides CBS 100239]|uniref:Averufin oxidase A n=1 Tax=Tolypocladium ophioglossoides (strain CBS 100239) TaxID=1163406 RepID=A0A0L0NAJ0_TOLOC|nr:Averufin oxidase A [Tolypocladium ophioglossoides CBS 100239]
MSTYAIIGATGNCGTALLSHLSRNTTAKVRAYCRNKEKLIKAAPYLQDNKRVEIFEGSIYDVDLLAQCITDTQAVFHVVSTNTNVPNCSVGLDTAKSIVRALERIRAGSSRVVKLPKIVLLSSATIDNHLSSKMPWLVRTLLLTSASYVYEDLRRTEDFLRTHQDTVTTIFIKPGGLSVDKQRGHRLDFDHEESFISYLDLAAAMIEAVDDLDGRYDMKNVGVVNTNGSARLPPGTPWCILTGLLRHYLPFLHSYLPTPGPA